MTNCNSLFSRWRCSGGFVYWICPNTERGFETIFVKHLQCRYSPDYYSAREDDLAHSLLYSAKNFRHWTPDVSVKSYTALKEPLIWFIKRELRVKLREKLLNLCFLSFCHNSFHVLFAAQAGDCFVLCNHYA